MTEQHSKPSARRGGGLCPQDFCRAKPRALGDRILEYCEDGSHKSAIINKALQRGYELWVRVKTSGRSSDRSRKTAGNMENELLQRYNYAWNVRNNAIRDILTD